MTTKNNDLAKSFQKNNDSSNIFLILTAVLQNI